MENIYEAVGAIVVDGKRRTFKLQRSKIYVHFSIGKSSLGKPVFIGCLTDDQGNLLPGCHCYEKNLKDLIRELRSTVIEHLNPNVKKVKERLEERKPNLVWGDSTFQQAKDILAEKMTLRINKEILEGIPITKKGPIVI